MLKRILIFVSVLTLAAGLALAGERQLTFEWQQKRRGFTGPGQVAAIYEPGSGFAFRPVGPAGRY